MMLSLYYAFFFIMGLCVGSFLNVVILRYGTGFSVTHGRSECFSCGKRLRFWELLPLVSFLMLRGKCSTCNSKISFQYPLVELATAILFLSLAHLVIMGKITPLLFPLYLSVFSILVVITVYDFRHKIIPDLLVWLFNGITLLIALYKSYMVDVGEGLVQYQFLLAGPLFFLPFFLLWYFSKGRLIGLGDGKLVIGIGFLLGISYGLSALAVAFWVGAITTMCILSLTKLLHDKRISFLWLDSLHLTMKSEVPFAPFLIGGALFIFFFPIDIFSLHIFGF